MRNNIIKITENGFYKTCVSIPPATNNKVFIPTDVICDEKMRLEDIATYGILCSLNGKASLKQLKSKFRKPTKNILNSLRHLIKLGYVCTETSNEDDLLGE